VLNLPSTFVFRDGGEAKSEPYRLYNLDVFEYELDSPMALYGSVPFMVAHKVNHGAHSSGNSGDFSPLGSNSVGIFWHNSAEMWVDIDRRSSSENRAHLHFDKSQPIFSPSKESETAHTHWFAESGVVDLFLFLGPSPKDVQQQYSKITGTGTLPPVFSMAYHQCRWNYIDVDDVYAVEEGFDANQIPLDVIWLDIEHTDGKRYFTWDSAKFEDAQEMQNRLAANGRKVMA
jgi:alpha 1,3-glucosidase